MCCYRSNCPYEEVFVPYQEKAIAGNWSFTDSHKEKLLLFQFRAYQHMDVVALEAS
jgi:hypothetical protein